MKPRIGLLSALGMALVLGSTAPAMTVSAQEEVPVAEAEALPDMQTVSFDFMEFEVPVSWYVESVEELGGVIAMPDEYGQTGILVVAMELPGYLLPDINEAFMEEDFADLMETENYKREIIELGETALGDTIRIELAEIKELDGVDTLVEYDFYVATDEQRLYIVVAVTTNPEEKIREIAAGIVVGATTYDAAEVQ